MTDYHHYAASAAPAQAHWDHYMQRLNGPPSPYVTHQDLAPVHSRIGALQEGHATLASTYNHLRGEMLTRFDKLEKMIEAQQQPQKGVNFTVRELAALVAAIALGGILIGSRFPSVAALFGG